MIYIIGIEGVVETCIDLVNENGGFKVIGWHKRSKIIDQTLVHQESNEETT